ncbi:cyclic nucleotide phosphodiesterase, putative [Perkinsus marinus ATCC 50983]|uniref:Phosphodiesterase n=1 Tax=Perkinsus marinus (strain ATCC 50983 / TXsc) TaxID=423536 RepID=C5LIQ9_PERM5|nr:cyclic nucleotide phosphodiesterase, putative [Perkinsus marinus ATCC 50983]EER03462.1 cyclic nucleotide phosphodiesterase, putative [Perkinsus marinus ATCC 50983]|eukprot:XP_002771646.1 cyclic nucleotide phosphodiesterase, putative [Perkinsus marinus ATCC 50983]
MPGGEYSTVCFVDDYEELLTRVGHDFTLDVEELWTSHQESRRNPECVLALYMTVARACFPDDQANRILNIGSESHDGLRCPVYERFLSELCSRYLLSVPYHNAVHAAQVTHHCAAIINSLGIRSRLSDLDWASLIIACMSHDVGHFGHTNKFLIETRHPLALRYNDRSVMENYHAATMFDMLKESEDWDISRGLSRSELKRFRSQIVALILSTDIEALPKLADQIKVCRHSSVDMLAADSRLIRGLSISMADCGHVWLTWDLHYKWAVRLSAEFAAEARELAKVNRQVTAPPWTDSSPASNVDPSPRTQISFIERWPIVMIEALESLIGIDETGFSSTACEWSKAVRRAIRDNVSHWKESEASVVDTDAAVDRVAAPEAKVESATVKSDGRDNRRVPRSSADDEPPMLSYSALYNTDGTSLPPATSRRSGSSSSGSEIASSEQPQGNSQQLALQRGQQNSDDDEDPPVMSYSDLYGSAAAATRSANMDDPDEPPMLSYGDLYSRLGGMQGSR